MISLLICNTAENKHCLTLLSQIMSFRGPSYRHRDLHLLHAQVLSYNNKSLSYKSMDTKQCYSKVISYKKGTNSKQNQGISLFITHSRAHILGFYKVFCWLVWTGSV